MNTAQRRREKRWLIYQMIAIVCCVIGVGIVGPDIFSSYLAVVTAFEMLMMCA